MEGRTGELFRNVVAGLTVSFVAISLGAAFGILSGRGAFAGMLSAGVIAFLTAWLGGTRIQCSGPTAPMTAVTATLIGFAHAGLIDAMPGADQTHFINLVIILTGLLLILFAVLRLGRFITKVPRVVVSGFMNGIAILIWLDQGKRLFGFGVPALGGEIAVNASLALVTFALVMWGPGWMKKSMPRVSKFLPVTLLTIVFMTVLSLAAGLDVERVSLELPMTSLAEFGAFVNDQIPRDWSIAILVVALPYALQLAMLGYLDTLLTSLVVDKLTGEQTAQDRELVGQGIANAAVGFLGGIPGAQATIRSVLIVKEGASMRLAGMLVGVFVVLELVLFKGLITQIPHAVFAGLLFKVGYDVFDWLPLGLWVRELASGPARLMHHFFGSHVGQKIFVTNMEMLFIAGTTLVTVFWNLNAAVIGFGLLFFLMNRWFPMRDLAPEMETAGVEEGD